MKLTIQEINSLVRMHVTPGDPYYTPVWEDSIGNICECGISGYEDLSEEDTLKIIIKIAEHYLNEKVNKKRNTKIRQRT